MVKAGLKRWKWVAGVCGMFVVATGALSVLQPVPAVHALPIVTVSPNDADIIPSPGGPTDPTFPRSFDHVLKKENTSDISTLQMSAYFSTPSPTELIRIDNRTNFYSKCSVQGNSNQFIQVIISDGASSLTYNIRQDRICSGATNGTNLRTNLNGARFFGFYQVPSTFTIARPVDPDTNLYKLNITIRYNSSIPFGDTNVSTKRQIVSFKVRLNTCGAAPGCTKYIGTAPIGGGNRNYSTLGYTDSQKSANSSLPVGFSDQYFKFGLGCTETTQRLLSVKVYDVDNQTNWGGRSDPNGRFAIEYRQGPTGTWTRMSLAGATITQSAPAGTPAPTVTANVIKPAQASGITVNVQFWLQPGYNYRVHAMDIYSNNLLGIGLPRDTIFGDIQCSSGLDGNISVTPTTAVIEDGQSITMTPQTIRSGASTFPSRFDYTWRTWYDTGDNAYQAGEELACPYVAQNNVTQTGTGTVNRPNTCTGAVSSGRSGGRAVAICAQLVVTAADAFTTIGAGAPPDGIKKCIPIGKYPHLEARNGDVFAGGKFASVLQTCTMTAKPVVASSQRQIPTGGNAYFTSYATYGVTSLGSSTTFGSMGVSYDASATTIADNLVFANTSSVDGYFYNPTGNNNTPTATHCLNDPFAIFGPRATTDLAGNNIDISTLTGDTNLTDTGQISLYASQPIPSGKKIVIYAKSADIKISSNIVYADQTYNSINEIPQLVILTDRSIIVRWNAFAGALSTGGKVTQLDGIYGAKVNFYSCDLIPRLHTCDTALQLNGAVVVGENTVPLRTAGADGANLSAMAETFNLRSDMFINQLPEAGGPNVYIKTLSETEVPPRF